jgi:uncharacterized membrane protein
VTIESYRTLGGIGAVLTVLGAVSSVLSIFQYANPTSLNIGVLGVSGIVSGLGFIGFILFLVAMYGFSREYQERRIFNLIIYGIVITIVAAVIALAIWLVFFLANILPNLNPNPSTDIQSLIAPYLTPIIATFGFVGLINIVFNVRAFNLLADKSKAPLFRTGAKVLLLGGLLTVVLGLVFVAFADATSMSLENISLIAIPGALVQYAAWALLAKAFFSVKAPPNQTATSPYASPITSQSQVKYCPNCGAQNLTDALYCTRCGQKLP